MSDKMPKEEKQNLGVEKQALLQMSEISLILDTYDDIFSDFDPRHYSQRALSDDFLQEIKRASRDKPTGTIEIKFMMPAHLRSREQENIIARRLHEHFHKHYLKEQEEIKRIKREGLLLAGLGVLFLFISAYLYTLSEKLFIYLLIVIFEPAGWFSVWTGLDQWYYTAKSKKPDAAFYEKMSKADISFVGY